MTNSSLLEINTIDQGLDKSRLTNSNRSKLSISLSADPENANMQKNVINAFFIIRGFMLFFNKFRAQKYLPILKNLKSLQSLKQVHAGLNRHPSQKFDLYYSTFLTPDENQHFHLNDSQYSRSNFAF